MAERLKFALRFLKRCARAVSFRLVSRCRALGRLDTAAEILRASNDVADPLWRLPLFDAYERHLDGGHAAMSSTGASGYGGAITAALFLRRFAGKQTNWAHIDVMAWNLGGRPGRPKGGEAMGLRALFTYIERLAGR